MKTPLLIFFIGKTGSGKTTLGRKLSQKLKNCNFLSYIEPVIDSLCAILRDKRDNYTDPDLKRSLAVEQLEGEKTYQQLLSEHMVAIRTMHSSWILAANLQQRIRECIKNHKKENRQFRLTIIVDDVLFNEDLQWLLSENSDKAIVKVWRCIGDPAKLALRSGKYNEDLANNDTDRFGEESAEDVSEIETETDGSDEWVEYLKKVIDRLPEKNE